MTMTLLTNQDKTLNISGPETVPFKLSEIFSMITDFDVNQIALGKFLHIYEMVMRSQRA